MSKKREKLHKSMQEETSKKIMKKTRTGEWVVASMLGLMLLGYGVVNIGVEDTDGVEIPTEQLAEEDGATDEDPNKVVVTNDSKMEELEQEQEEVSSEVTLGEGSLTVDLGLQNVLQPEDFGNVNNEVVTTDEYDNDSGNFVDDNKDNNNTPEEIIEDEQEVEEEQEVEDEQEGDELPEESETDIEPEEDPVIEETEPEVEEPVKDEVEEVEEGEDKEEVVPVDPEKDKEVEETEPEVVPQPKPETPQEPVEGEQEEDVKEEEVQTPVITTSTRTETEQIGYNVIKRENSELAKGEERVVQVGQFGLLEKVFGLTFEDGKLVLEELLSSNVLTNPIDKIIEIGTYEEQAPVITTSERTETSQIKFTEVRRENPDMPLGEEKVVQEGSYGTLVKTYKVTYEDGVEVSSELVSEVVTEDPVNTIIEFGTFVQEEPEETEPEVVITTETRTETEDIDFEVEYVESSDLLVGEERVVTEGVNGQRELVFEQTFEDGELVDEVQVSDTVIKDAVNKVIEVGTKEVKTETNTESIDFDVIYQDNDELEVGLENTLVEGEAGEREIVTEKTFVKGELVGEEVISDTVTKNPVNKVIERGTLVITTQERIETEDIEFEVERVANNTMFEGEERVVTEGVNGQRKKVYEQTFHNGVLVNEELVSNEVDSNPINKVIEYGTIKVTTGVELEEIILNYETETIENPDLETGTTRVIQEGKNGKIERTYEVTYHDGVEVDNKLVDTKTTDPIKRIIEVGVAKVTTKTEVIVEITDFETEYRYRDDMYVDEENELQHGITGRVDITVEHIYHDGVLVDTVEVSRQVIATPTTQVIEVGTKERPEEPETPVEDENQPVITTKVVSTGKMISEDYEVIRIANPDMLLGQEKVVQEGYNGLKVIRELVTYEDGYEVQREFYDYQYMTETQNQIVEYGTKFEITPDGQADYTDRVNEVLAKTDEEQYQLAIKNREILEDGMISHEESKDLLDPYYYLTKAELTALYLAVDYDKLNDEFGKLINEHRAGLGLESLGYYEEYKTGSELISKELADYGYIAPEGQAPHTRPDDGRTTTTVFQDIDEDLYNRGVGENLTFHYNLNNPYTIVSEKYLAETMFESWMKSEGHKRNMESAVYTGYAFAIYPVMNNNTKTADRADDGGYENYREVEPHNGIGIMGTLTLIRDAQ